MSAVRFGPYELVSRLATGGMAQVYLARERLAGGAERTLVVKRILPHLAENDEFVKMFLQEARVAARLHHPNVAQIFDVGKESGSYYIAMEYVHGEDLRRIAKQAAAEGRTFPVPLSVRVLIGASRGLHAAHEQADEQGRPLGIVHRDVSPQNLLVTFDGEVKVIDFGIAKASDGATQTRTGVLKGKYSYMSPEQADGLRVDRRSDVFALGVVLYELVTQQRLFKKPTDMATVQAVLACQVERPSRYNPAIDPALEGVILRALSKRREDRTPTAAQLADELEEYLTSHRQAGSEADLRRFMREIYADRMEGASRLEPQTVRSAGRDEVLVEVLVAAAPEPGTSRSAVDGTRFRAESPTVAPSEGFEIEEERTATALRAARLRDDPMSGTLRAPAPLQTSTIRVDPAHGLQTGTIRVDPSNAVQTDTVRAEALLHDAPTRTGSSHAAQPPLRVDSEPPSATRVERTVLSSRNRRSPEQSSTHRTKPQTRGRRPLLLAAAGVGLLLLGLGVGGLWMARRRPVLELDSDPPRVSVLLDGADVGHTPMRVALERGSHELVLAADGFKPLRHSLPPFSGTQPLKLTLTKKPGKLSIVTVPEGAIVTLDGQVQQSHSPTTITDVSADQPHDVVLTFEGYEEVHVRGLVVPAGQLITIEKALIQRAPDPIEPPK